MSQGRDVTNLKKKKDKPKPTPRVGVPFEQDSTKRKNETSVHALTKEVQNTTEYHHQHVIKYEQHKANPREAAARKHTDQGLPKEGKETERKLSLPPGTESAEEPTSRAQRDTDISKLSEALAGISVRGEEDITSLSATLREFLPKLVQVDRDNKRLKDTVTILEDKLAKTEAALQRSNYSNGSKDGKHPDEQLRREEEYIKIRRQLKRALDANQGWSEYCHDQLKVHLNQLHTKDEQLRHLQEKVKESAADKELVECLQRQLKEMQKKFEDCESEGKSLHIKNQKLEDEQRQVRKLAKGLMKDKEDLQKERDILKERVAQMQSAPEAIESAEDIPSMDSGEAKTSSDSGTVLSYPLRNVETTMNVEEIRNMKRDSRGREPSTAKDHGGNVEYTAGQDAIASSNDSSDVISFLQEQVQQYRDDFNKERQDRERAVGELDKLRKELENTKLLLHQQKEVQSKKRTKKGLFGSKHKSEKPKSEAAAGFRCLGPDEVSQLQRELPPRNARQPDNHYDEGGGEPGNHVYHEIKD